MAHEADLNTVMRTRQNQAGRMCSRMSRKLPRALLQELDDSVLKTKIKT